MAKQVALRQGCSLRKFFVYVALGLAVYNTRYIRRSSSSSSKNLKLSFANPRESLASSIGSNVTAMNVLETLNCPVTTSIKIEPTKEKATWILHTFDEKGRRKSIGGDEFYITWGHAVAEIQDLRNGKYQLDFYYPPMSQKDEFAGLRVYLEYTCGIGFMPPPLKKRWKGGGAINQVATLDAPPTPCKRFVTPSEPDLTEFDKVIALGDATMAHVGRKSPYISMGQLIRKSLNEDTVEYYFNAIKQMHDEDLKSENKTALLLGSGVRDIFDSDTVQGPSFPKNLVAYRRLIEMVQAEYPRVSIIWKAPSAVHIHRVGEICLKMMDDCRERIKYMSSSRAYTLYREQKKLMEELGIPFMDIYRAYYLSASETVDEGGRQYSDDLGIAIINWFA